MLSAYVSSKRNWAIAASFLAAMSASAQAGPYLQTNLVSNIPGLATLTDPALVNPWGFSHSATSPYWISDQGTNEATLYAVTGQTSVAKVNIAPNGFVAIPTTAGGPQGPTGQVNVAASSPFLVNNITPNPPATTPHASFIFADLNGTISAWAGAAGGSAVIQRTVPSTVFTGLTVNAAQNQLFAASAGGVFAFDGTYTVTSTNAFVTPTAIASLGLVVFNVKDISGKVYVTYAPAGRPAQIAATGGMGAVAVFDESGNLLTSILSNQLASPWGIALAPSTFGPLGGDLLVGNFSFAKSQIDAFDPLTGTFLGSLPIDTGSATPGGLWEIGFGSGGSNGDPNTLYFNDGINGETAGLFGAITFVPEPLTLSIFAAGLAGTALLRRRRRNGVTSD